jgi:hypothetical protein
MDAEIEVILLDNTHQNRYFCLQQDKLALLGGFTKYSISAPMGVK